MDQKLFVSIVKNEMKEFFYKQGYTKCHSNSSKLKTLIFFEKKIDNYELPIVIQWQDKIRNSYSFIVYFLNIFLCDNEKLYGWDWKFSNEEELREKLNLVKEKCISEKYFEKVELRAKEYFI